MHVDVVVVFYIKDIENLAKMDFLCQSVQLNWCYFTTNGDSIIFSACVKLLICDTLY